MQKPPSFVSHFAAIAFLAAVYCVSWLAHYSHTPLGKAPAYPDLAPIRAAAAFAEGTVATTDLNSAPLYPYFLSRLILTDFDQKQLLLAARVLNLVSFVIIVACALSISRRLWMSPVALWITGVLIGFNPVVVFLTGDPGSILPATACFMLAAAIVSAWYPQPKAYLAVAIGALLGLAAAFHSLFFAPLLAWPLIAPLMGSRTKLWQFAGALAGVAAGLALIAGAYQISTGEARIVPPFAGNEFLKGNHAEASGRVDTRFDDPSFANLPGKRQESGNNRGAFEEALSGISADPARWLALALRKAYYFLNTHEQYDLKTFEVQRTWHVLLFFNPLNWGILLLLATLGLYCRFASYRDMGLPFLLILFAIAMLAGAVLFYNSYRLRVPVVPLLAVLSGGLVLIQNIRKNRSKRTRKLFVAGFVAILAITFSRFWNVRNPASHSNDYAMLAIAALHTDFTDEAVIWATRLQEADPGRREAELVHVIADFRKWALSTPPRPITFEDARQLRNEAREVAGLSSEGSVITGIYEWKTDQEDAALERWRSESADSAFALLCLFWTKNQAAPDEAMLLRCDDNRYLKILREAVAIDRSAAQYPPLAKTLDNIFTRGH